MNKLLRADRFITLGVARPIMALAGTGAPRVPILMYHGISSDAGEHGVHPYYRTFTAPEVFARHMYFLAEHGYQTISLDSAARRLRSEPGIKDGLPARPVVITFDDGFRDFHINAFPILSRYGFSATVFLPAAMIKQWPAVFDGRERLSWADVRELHGEGIYFGSHTMTHANLRTMRKDEIEFELRCSRDTIEDRMGTPVESFSYPYAFPEGHPSFVAFLMGALKKYGYKNGVSTRIGVATPEKSDLFLKRLPMNSCDDDKLFRAKIGGAYDWLSVIQRASKTLDAKLGRLLTRSAGCRP